MHPIDFSSADQANRLASHLLYQADQLRLTLPGAPPQSREAATLITRCRHWLTAVHDRMAHYTPGDALLLTDTYDIIHRLVHQQPADPSFLNPIRLRALEARIHGDTTVDEYTLYRVIDAAVRRRDPLFLGRPLHWLTLTLDRWYHRLKKQINSFPSGGTTASAPFKIQNSKSKIPLVSDYDTQMMVSLLLTADLSAYEGPRQAAFKQRLRTQYIESPHAQAI